MTENMPKSDEPLRNILITGAHGMLGRFLCHEFGRRFNVVTLGLCPDNDIVCDLSVNVPRLPGIEFTAVIHAAGTTNDAQAMAVNHQGTINLCKALDNSGPVSHVVFISSAAVYGLNCGENISEDASLKPTSDYGQSKALCEEYLSQWCDERGATLSILRPPMIMGTGMKGTLRSMVNGINSGYYFNIKGNTARRSIVHAADVADAAMKLMTVGGTYNITDRIDPMVNTLGEALAHRINQKRIYTLPRTLVRLILPPRLFMRLSTSLTFNCDRLSSAIEWQPRSVTDYLFTHQYDDNDI